MDNGLVYISISQVSPEQVYEWIENDGPGKFFISSSICSDGKVLISDRVINLNSLMNNHKSSGGRINIDYVTIYRINK
jgi:hypothetical protein